MNRHLVATVIAALAAPCASAQLPCAGSTLTGTVHDSSNALIPDATLTLDHARTVHSSLYGHFDIPCIASGAHRLTVSAANFALLDFSFKAPHLVTVELTLKPETVLTSVDVTPGDITPDPTTTGFTQTLSGKSLQVLADDPDDLLRELQQMASTAGGIPTNTTIAIDGFQDSTHLPPKSSIAYIKVNPDLYSAEYRQPPFTGGRVEIYTKPGQSAFHGALFTTNGSSFMNARDPFSTSKAPLGKQRYGFELSGPVRKTGSDFSLTLEHRSIDDFAVVNAITLNSSGNQAATINNVATPQSLWLPTARLDWQLGKKNTFIASYGGSINSLGNVGVGGTALAETGYTSQQFDHTLRISDITTISAHLMHEARLSSRWDGETDIPVSTAAQVQVAGAFTSGGTTIGNQRLHEQKLEIDDDAILTTAHHTLKFGVQIFVNDEHDQLTTNFNGTYIFGGGTAPVLDSAGNPIAGQITAITGLEQYRRTLLGLAGGTPTAYSDVTGTPQVNFVQTHTALFLQDEWTLAHGLHISSGMRYSLQNAPLMLNGATPRLGVQWAPGKTPKWTIHAHVGLFVGDFSPTEEAEVLREDGNARITTTIYNPVYGNPLLSATPILSIRTLAPHLSNYSYATENIGGTYLLPHGWNLLTDFFPGRIWNSIRSNNINAPFNDSPFGPRPGAANLNILQVQNSSQGRFSSEFVGIDQHSLKRLQLFLGAVHVVQIDDNNDDTFFTPQNSRSDAGEFAQRSIQPVWLIFGNSTITLPHNLQLSGNLFAGGGARYNITTGFDNNGDGDFNDRPQYAQPNTPGAISTPYGLLVTSGGTGVFPRDAGRMPWTCHLDANLQRNFKLTRNPNAEHQQTITANLRSSNILNHTNVTQVGGVLGSPLFRVPYAADNGRRIEAGLRYSF